jgi:hypothetical protein
VTARLELPRALDRQAPGDAQTWFGVELWTEVVRRDGSHAQGWWSSGAMYDSPADADAAAAGLVSTWQASRWRVVRLTLTREVVTGDDPVLP